MTKLRFVLRKLSFTGRQLADMCGMSRSSVYKYLSGDRELSLKTARARFEPVLGVSAEELVGMYEPDEVGKKH